MRKELATLALADVLGASRVAGAALVAPPVSYAATGDSTALDTRITSLRQALTGLVTDGSLTQSQADEVEARPEGFGRGGRGGRGGGGRIDVAAAAEALGTTEEELRTRTQAGSTLADIAEAKGGRARGARHRLARRAVRSGAGRAGPAAEHPPVTRPPTTARRRAPRPRPARARGLSR